MSKHVRRLQKGAALVAFREALQEALGAGLTPAELAREIQGQDAGNLTEAELQARWQAPSWFLPKLREEGTGPEWVQAGRRILYPLESVRAFERQRNRGNAPTFLGTCKHHGLTWFRQIRNGTSRSGNVASSRRCLKCMAEATARRYATRRGENV